MFIYAETLGASNAPLNITCCRWLVRAGRQSGKGRQRQQAMFIYAETLGASNAPLNITCCRWLERAGMESGKGRCSKPEGGILGGRLAAQPSQRT